MTGAARRWLFAVTACVGMAGGVQGQGTPRLQVTASLQPQGQVQLGATVRLELEVVTSTWFTQPPQLPALALPGALVKPPSGQGEIVRHQQHGVAFSGLRYTYLITPTSGGTLQIPRLTVSAEVGLNAGQLSASSEPLQFDVAAGTGAAGGQPAIGQLNITQDYALAPDPLVAGGRVTRRITQRAEGIQPMLLLAAPLDDVPGFKRYPRPPEVTTLTDGRGGFLGGQRIDAVDYVARKPGRISLPPLTLRWRDSATGEPRKQELPGRSFEVGAAATADPVFSLAEDLQQLRQSRHWAMPASWLAWALGTATAALVVFLAWGPLRRGLDRAGSCIRRWRLQRQASEGGRWRAWQKDARRPAPTVTTFYRWLRVVAGANDMRGAAGSLGSAVLAEADAALQAGYANTGSAVTWRTQLAESSRHWRRKWRMRHFARAHAPLSSTLNPEAAKRPCEPRGT